MDLGPTVLLVYGVLMLLGGVMGARAGSTASLVSGSVSGTLLLVAWFVTRDNPELGLWIGIVVTALLSIVFTIRTVATGRVVPAGALLGVSALALVLLGLAVARI